MPTTIAQKQKIKEGFTLLTIDAPASFSDGLGDLPPGVSISKNAKTFDQVHWFVATKADMAEGLDRLISLLKEGVTGWIYFPKSTSKMQTDLNRDRVWENLSKYGDVQMVSLISFDDTWSAFGAKRTFGIDKKKEATPKERPIFQYINAAKKEVYPPDDFAEALRNAAKEEAFFESLSFSNKKEYVEWIVTAKREETRTTRIKESVERLAKGWKNPANR